MLLAYPCRYSDMIPRFAKPVPVLCMITNTVVDYIYDQHHATWYNWMEPDNSESCQAGPVCCSYLKEGSYIKLFRVYRWDCQV
jgi:hypothetical protein